MEQKGRGRWPGRSRDEHCACISSCERLARTPRIALRKTPFCFWRTDAIRWGLLERKESAATSWKHQGTTHQTMRHGGNTNQRRRLHATTTLGKHERTCKCTGRSVSRHVTVAGMRLFGWAGRQVRLRVEVDQWPAAGSEHTSEGQTRHDRPEFAIARRPPLRTHAQKQPPFCPGRTIPGSRRDQACNQSAARLPVPASHTSEFNLLPTALGPPFLPRGLAKLKASAGRDRET